MMWTNNKGESFYKYNNRYFKSNGWVIIEISKDEYNKNVKNKEGKK
ncbi:hypothetical protein M0Q39_06230 [Patescibacteria group bacterium]|nr:hypothetical protein [Patescibacteria group bacterium]